MMYLTCSNYTLRNRRKVVEICIYGKSCLKRKYKIIQHTIVYIRVFIVSFMIDLLTVVKTYFYFIN